MFAAAVVAALAALAPEATGLTADGGEGNGGSGGRKHGHAVITEDSVGSLILLGHFAGLHAINDIKCSLASNGRDAPVTCSSKLRDNSC